MTRRCKHCDRLLTDAARGGFCTGKCRAGYVAERAEDAAVDWTRVFLTRNLIRASWSPEERASRRIMRRLPLETMAVHRVPPTMA